MGAIYGTGSATGSRYMGSRANHGLMSQVAQCMGTGTAYQVVRNTNTVTAVKLQSMDKLMQASGTVHPLTNSRDALAGEGHLAGNSEFLIVQAGMGVHLDSQQSLSCLAVCLSRRISISTDALLRIHGLLRAAVHAGRIDQMMDVV